MPGASQVARLPLCIRVLLESSLRNCSSGAVSSRNVETVLDFERVAGRADVAWLPPRVIMQDLSGLPALVDVCAMRDAVAARGGDPRRVSPRCPVDLVVDHSVAVDVHGRPDALRRNMAIELERNAERFRFLRWAERSFENFRVLPPGSGIIHQVNCESLASVVMVGEDGVAFPDACVGTDSHTPMVNGLGVLGWGVGGIEVGVGRIGCRYRFRYMCRYRV